MSAHKEIQKLKTLLDVELHDNISKLCNIWTEIGVSESQIVERSHKVAFHLNDLLNEMVSEEENLKSRYVENTRRHILMASEISKKLQLPFEQPECLTLLEKEREMKSLVEKLQKLRDKRIDEWQNLRELHRDCSLLMMMKPMEFDTNSEIPTLCDIGHLQIQVYDVEKELDVRKKQMSDYKKAIKRLVGELDYKLETGEKLLVSDDIGDLLYSKVNVEQHKKFSEKLEAIKKQNLIEILSYKEELKRPFEFKLDGEEAYNEEEFNHFCMLKDKVKSKRHKIKLAVQKKQAELLNLWDLCQVTCKHKDDKNALLNEDMEQVDCILLKEEIVNMEKYYNDRKDILVMHKSYREMFFDLREAEKKCIQLSRHIRTTGSSWDEKTKHKISKEIFKLQEKLMSKVTEWEAKNDQKFLFMGMNLSEYIEYAHGQLKSSKEAWKLEVKGKQSEALPPVPVMTPFKRKMANITPSKIAAKILRLEGSTPISSRQNVPRTPLSTRKQYDNQPENPSRSHKKPTSRQELHRQNSSSSPKDALRRSQSDLRRSKVVARKSGQPPVGRVSRGSLHSNSNSFEKNAQEMSDHENKNERFIDETASYEDFSRGLARTDKSFISSSVIALPKTDSSSQKFFAPIKF